MPFLVIDGFTAGFPARRAPPRSSKQTAQVARLDPAKVHGPSMPGDMAFGRHFVGDLELSCLPRVPRAACADVAQGLDAVHRRPGREPTAVATVMSRTGAVSESRPAPTLKAGVNVMLEATRDELPAIQRL